MIRIRLWGVRFRRSLGCGVLGFRFCQDWVHRWGTGFRVVGSE